MQVHSGTVSNVKTEIVDVATLLGKLKGHANGRAHTNGHGHRPRPQLRDGYRVAALKAHTGASLMNRPGMSLRRAAACVGSSPMYVAAMLVILADPEILGLVLAGEVPVLAAAAKIKRVTRLVDAFWSADPVEREKAGRIIGIERIFDTMIVPTLPAVK
jgi:hypothetical protein